MSSFIRSVERGERTEVGPRDGRQVLMLAKACFNDLAFRCTLETIDNDKVYFSADYPFERMEDAADWYDATGVISEEQRRKIGRSNAIRLFKLALK